MTVILLVAMLLWAVPAEAACTPNVALTASAIQTALRTASAGSTICLPSGTLTTASTIDAAVSPIAATVTLQGQTVCTGAGQTIACTDATILVNGTAKLMSVALPTTGTFRVTGITFTSVASPSCTSGASASDHPMSFAPFSGYATMRLDHNHFINFCRNNFESDSVRGVADHNHFYNVGGAPGNNQVRPFGADTDTEWTQATQFGTSTFNWFYFEDNRWDFGISNDCYSSGRQVFRYNYMVGSGVQEHGTGHSSTNRGCRALEVYGNTMIGDNNANRTTAVAIYSGSGMVWGNTIDYSLGTCSLCANALMLDLVQDRQSNYTYTQSPTPNSFGYCGTNFNGTGSVWDGNQNASGYPCLDGVGRGPGDLLSGDPPAKRNNTRNCTVNFTWANRAANCDTTDSSANPRQALEPVYEWLNTGTAPGGWVGVFRDPGTGGGGISDIQANRDYYVGKNNVNCNAGAGSCTAGVGSGTRGQRPVNCVAGPGGNTPGVAWWSTDQGGNWNTTNGTANDGTLDVCTATNTWTNGYYTPLTYPHPLAAGATGTPPATPSGLQIIP